MNDYQHIFIPSYHRSDNLKTVKYFLKINWDPKKIHVFIDSETDDIAKYESSCHEFGVNLHVFDMDEARRRYDYVHRPSKARRSAIKAEKQVKNGNRIHHKINNRYLSPKIIKDRPEHDNIAWDTYPEDYPFTNEPKNRQSQ